MFEVPRRKSYMIIIFEQVFTLFAFALAGFALSKFGKVKADHTQILSGILVYVFSTCNVFKTFVANFTVEYISQRWYLILVSAVVLLVLAVAARYASTLFSKEKYVRQSYEYTLVIPNYGYVGYALCESLLGLAALLDMVIFALPLTGYVYMKGYPMLTKSGVSLKKIFNANIIAMLIGAAVGLSGIEMPALIMNIAEKSSACMGPVSMLLMGITISEFDLIKLVNDKKVYITSFLRLVVVPVLVGFALKPFCPIEVVQIAVLLYAMPCGLNTIVFPKLVGERCELGASWATVSNILACATIPMVLALFGIG